jgi:integrase
MRLHKLTRKDVISAKDGMHGDGGNLWLYVTNNGVGRSWLFRWTDRTGRDRMMGLGPVHTVDIDRARKLAADNRLLLQEGKDPMAVRDEGRLEVEVAQGKAKTISQVADEYFETKISRKSPNYQKLVSMHVNNHIRPTIGDMPIARVTRNNRDAVILEKARLRDLWNNQHPTGVLQRMHLQRIFTFAHEARGYITENPVTSKWLSEALAPRGDVHQVEHMDSLPYKDVFPFLERLHQRRDPDPSTWKYWRKRRDASAHLTPIKSLAIEMQIYTGIRHGEIRLAQWKEIDLETMTWTVPKAHKKIKVRDRAIPITPPMLRVLEAVRERTAAYSKHGPDDLIFPGVRGKVITASQMATFLRKQVKWPQKVDPHGFRSTLRDWMRAETKFDDVLWMIQCDHVLGDKTNRAYGHDMQMEKRREMMTAWAKYCTTPPAPKPQEKADQWGQSEKVVTLDYRRKAS